MATSSASRGRKAPAAPRTKPPTPSAKEPAKTTRSRKGMPEGGADAYGASSLTTLKGLEAVRLRPGMYIGNTSEGGLHHLIHELVDNSVDEAMAGHCKRIEVILEKDGACTVRDDGRGIPVDMNKTEKMTGVEMALGVLHSGGKFGTGTYKVSGGLHGVGAAVVNALSTSLVARITRGGSVHEITFAKGVKTSALRVVGKSKSRGTEVTFYPDGSIFSTTTFELARVAERLEELSYLNPGLELVVRDLREGKPIERRFKSPKGLDAWVRSIAGDALLGARVVTALGKDEERNLEVDVAIGYTPSEGEHLRTFVNSVRTPDGGTHETGVRVAWTRALTWALGEFGSKAQQKIGFRGDDVREGLVLLVSARVPEPQFEGQTKGRLGTAWVAGAAQSVTQEHLKAALKAHPRLARAILERVLESAQMRGAAQRARESARTQRNLVDVGVLPGKLADCTSSDASVSELILVEGDSAGGSAKQGRFREFQAILPLRGKILNAERAKLPALAANEELMAIATALGLSFQARDDLSRLRYGRVIIMTDADIDGAHIRTLLLTFFLRVFPRLVTEERIWVACPPLYRLTKGLESHYAFDEAERSAIVGRSSAWQVTRYKGLGEMSPGELKATAMDPMRRKLLQITMHDAPRADNAFTVLMGDDVGQRREWLFHGATLD